MVAIAAPPIAVNMSCVTERSLVETRNSKVLTQLRYQKLDGI